MCARVWARAVCDATARRAQERLRLLAEVRASKANVHAQARRHPPDQPRAAPAPPARAPTGSGGVQLDAFPFMIDTVGQRKAHEALTTQLHQLDAADKAFSRTKVVVETNPQ